MIIIPLRHSLNITWSNISTHQLKSKLEPIIRVKPLQSKSIIITPNRGTRREVTVLSSSSTKTYMDYKMITNKNSSQWKYIHNSGEIRICEDGLLRTEDDFIGVALGSFFKEIGTKWIFTLDTGAELKLIKVEEKADEHTCENGFMQKWDQSVIEFVVDTDKMNYAIGGNGLVYNGNFSNSEQFKGKIIKIEEVVE